MDSIDSQLKQLTKDVAVAKRIDDKRNTYVVWFAVSFLIIIPVAVGIVWPEMFVGVAALTSIMAGLFYGVMACSLNGTIVGLSLGFIAFCGGDIMTQYFGQDFVLIDTVTLIYIASVISLFALLPYLSTMVIHAYWSLTKRRIPGMSFINGFSWSTYDRVNNFKETIASDEITEYLDKRRDSNYLYRFELARLEDINAQYKTGKTKECGDWKPRAREQKCLDCNLKGVCPFQPGSVMEHLGDSHL